MSETSSFPDPISSKLDAIHDVVKAVRSHRIEHQLQNAAGDLVEKGDKIDDNSNKSHLCECGDPCCLDIRDIRQWLPESELDQGMQNLVLQLEESYLALGEAYKEDRQLDQALDTVKVACSLYDSYPQHLMDARFSPNLFSAKAWSLAGDVYSTHATHQWTGDEAFRVQTERKTSGSKKGIKQHEKSGKGQPYYIGCKSSTPSSNKEASARRGVATSSNRKKLNRRQNNLSRMKKPRSANFLEYLGSVQCSSPEKDLTAAIHCYESAIRAVRVSSSESTELSDAVVNKRVLTYHKLACYKASVGDYSKTVIADAKDAWSEVSGLRNIAKLKCEVGLFARTHANNFLKWHEKYYVCGTHSYQDADYLGAAISLHRYALLSYRDAQEELSSAGDEADPPLRDMVRAGLDETFKSLADLHIQELKPNYQNAKPRNTGTYLRSMNLDQNEVDHLSSNKTSYQNAKYYAYWAEEYWQDAIDLCAPEEHPVAYLKILLELSTFCLSLYSFDSYLMKEAALFHLLEARHIARVNGGSQPFPDPGVLKNFWDKLQALLREMCKMYSKPLCGNDAGVAGQKSASFKKMKKMYMKSITSRPTFTALHEIHREWFSEITS